MFERMLDKAVKPEYSELSEYCGACGELFRRFNDHVASEFATDMDIKFPYGNTYGWCASHHKKTKLICNVFAENGSFSVMI